MCVSGDDGLGGRGDLKKKKKRKKDSVSFSIVPTVNAMHYRDTKQAITA